MHRARLAALVALTLSTFAGLRAEEKLPAWRADYDSARREATEKERPIFLQVYSEGCIHCQRLDAGPLRNPAVVDLLNERYIPLRVDAAKAPKLMESLHIQMYPTMVIAATDGKIVAFLEGFQEAKALTDHLQRALAVQTPDWMARDFQEASKAVVAGDYAKAIPLLKSLLADGKDRTVQTKAKSVLDEIEQQAAGRLVRVTQLEDKGQHTEAVDLLTELLSRYPGTQAAGDGAKMLSRLAELPEVKANQCGRRAKDLLAQAREAFKAERYGAALELCQILETTYKDRDEGRRGGQLAAEIRSSPEKLALACEHLNERLASMYATLGDTWLRRGDKEQAAACFEKAVHASPASLVARDAQAKLSQLAGKASPVTTDFRKSEKRDK
jgi:tetratricopeptide (TPR) repeat protein